MSLDNYEIELKCLLPNRQAADELVVRMGQRDPNMAKIGVQKQLNHYFEGGNLVSLAESLAGLISDKRDQARLTSLAKSAESFSLRTRETNGRTLLILKISIDDTSSDNGTARLELEIPFNSLTIDQLDQRVLKAGFSYQAKWSREKTDYNYLDANVTLSFSPGYGYVAEFEKIVTNPELAEATKQELRQMIKELNVDELDQDRLGRMFAYYNAHWRDYYGSDRVFNIK